ncbi:hypothetical protein BRC19_00105 [Candidatus Saccharibacteria bacterium QS_5_54_17]|nr:MAG: hypothetical protein BRC19_00105 [Candidatus Saccharibacteria bacterium QS_5_54_17]
MESRITDFAKVNDSEFDVLKAYHQVSNKAQCAEEEEEFRDDFYPPMLLRAEDGSGESPTERREREQRAKDVCSRCVVQSACLNLILAAGWVDDGIWGGYTRREREAKFRFRYPRADSLQSMLTNPGP